MHCIVVVPSQDHMMNNKNLKRDIVMVHISHSIYILIITFTLKADTLYAIILKY